MTISLVLDFAIMLPGTPEMQMLFRICSCLNVSTHASSCSILFVLISVAMATLSIRSLVALILVYVSSLWAVILAPMSLISSLLAHFSIISKRSLIVGYLACVSVFSLSDDMMDMKAVCVCPTMLYDWNLLVDNSVVVVCNTNACRKWVVTWTNSLHKVTTE